jgi:hypothetical protein
LPWLVQEELSGIIVKESLPALVCDLFTFSGKIIASFIIKKEKKKKRKGKKYAPTGTRTRDFLVKKRI